MTQMKTAAYESRQCRTAFIHKVANQTNKSSMEEVAAVGSMIDALKNVSDHTAEL